MTVINEKYIKTDAGVELFVQEAGSGDPLVLIPGFTFTTEVFEKQVDYFSKTNRVIVLDPRSHGRSTVVLHGNDYVTHGADLHAVLEALEVTNAVIAGWSFGCLTAWEYVKQFGYDRVKSMIFVDMPPKSLSADPQDWSEGPLDDIAGIYNAFLRDSSGQRDFISGYITQVMVQRKLEEKDLTWLVEQSLKTPYYIAGNLFASGMFSDCREEAEKAARQVPTLNVVAEHWAETAVKYINRLTPEAKVEILGGHMMFWEHSEKFNRIVEHFIKESGKN
ncbi:alpha/beta fold hydrolase [Alteribacter natronophilus]|uniref:alpha/beta fold hydrolase n=1 Tax=Alteribacter natronophilus TaxID=2583810 RepID=UPI00110F26AB|nr:alpha/beta hydrolase [Alteribacter natronophilus]TMW71456.1 alpha/beta hydrolase [Alteribacter natronophilus]